MVFHFIIHALTLARTVFLGFSTVEREKNLGRKSWSLMRDGIGRRKENKIEHLSGNSGTTKLQKKTCVFYRAVTRLAYKIYLYSVKFLSSTVGERSAARDLSLLVLHLVQPTAMFPSQFA